MGTKYTSQASVSREFQIKTVIVCAVLMVFALIALGLAIYNIIKLRFGFVIGYLFGMALALMFILIKMNMAFSSRITADRRVVHLTVWENRLLPYKTASTVPFIREFIPEETIVDRIEISEIKAVYIGTKSFITRSDAYGGFDAEIKQLIPAEDIKKITKCDLLCICDESGGYHIMSLENFDIRAVSKIITNILRCNPNTEFATGSKQYRLYVRR